MTTPTGETYLMKKWQRWLLTGSLILGELLCFYFVTSSYIAGNFSWLDPYLIIGILNPVIGYNYIQTTYRFDGDTLVLTSPSLTRELNIGCLRHVKVEKHSFTLYKLPILLSPTFNRGMQDVSQLAQQIDGILSRHPDVTIKGSDDYLDQWFPQTYRARTM
jgi:hypothetical protein